MKNLKKLVSVVLALTMIISSMAFVSAKDFGDVDTTASYAEAVSVLADLSILNGDEEGNFNPDADIKRSEFAAVLCRALGQENAANGSKGVVVFDDVAADHWASGYIAWAAQQKIVNGKGDGKFDPDAPVKYDEAIKMIVVALGYEPMAAKKGGYPTGYMVVAGNNGITDGVKLAGGANAPRAIVAQLVYKALDVPLMDASYVSTKDEDYTIYDGEIASPRRTILSYYLDITKVKAEVLATAKTNSALAKKDGNDLVTLKLTNNYGFDWAKIFDGLYVRNDSDEFYVGASDIADYMAMSVVAYIGVNEDDNFEVVACVGDAKSVNILEVTEGIEVATYTPADPTASPAVAEGFTFEYFENEDDYRTTEVDIAPTATVYVNGKAVADTEFDNIITEGASKVVFMGAKGGNYDYDKVFITEYDFAVVDEVNVEDEYIKLVTGGSVDLSKEVRGDKFAYTLTFDGAEIALEDLQAGDLLNVLCGGDWKNDSDVQVDIIVTRDAVEGIVEEEVKAGETYVINGEEYDISAK
ncbi:MAG: S-layer homology domain-containing protein, partial [Clostridia bacterium]|nr:S-layer homology domain-containing protein [Clostridia bacterium]